MDRILVVDDDPFCRDTYRTILAEEGYHADAAASGQEALDLLARNDYTLIVSELVFHDMSGLDLLTRAKRHDAAIDVIIITGHANVETAIFALKNGARDYLVKPFNHDELKHSIALCLEQRRLIDENLELKELLNLFKVGQTIANCIELERLQFLIIEVLARELGLERAIGLFCGTEDASFKFTSQGLGEDEAAALREIITPRLFPVDESGTEPQRIERIPLTGDDQQLPAGVTEAVVLPIRSKGKLHGIVALFNPLAGVVPTDLNQKHVAFILDQSALAIENASRYTSATTLMYVDELTGLYNYRYLDVSLEREIKRAERYGSSISVIFIDLDLFKTVNDNHGHLVGSRVLHEVGALLKRSVREVDTIVRYGGDEYTIILTETGERGAAIVAERIRKAIEDHPFLAEEGYDIGLSASVGYACYPDDTRDKRELLDLADKAMYRGKASGKNIVFRATIVHDK